MDKDIIEKENVSVKFPQSGGITLTPEDVKKDADSKFKDMNFLIFTVVIILVVMVATLVIDSFHINSVTYKEYSQKTETIEVAQKINQQLLEQNIKNQELIIRLLNSANK